MRSCWSGRENIPTRCRCCAALRKSIRATTFRNISIRSNAFLKTVEPKRYGFQVVCFSHFIPRQRSRNQTASGWDDASVKPLRGPSRAALEISKDCRITYCTNRAAGALGFTKGSRDQWERQFSRTVDCVIRAISENEPLRFQAAQSDRTFNRRF